MTQRISKAGRRYTVGSSSTPPRDMPRVCVSCGERILTSRQSYQHHVEDATGRQFAFHIPLCSPWRKAA